MMMHVKSSIVQALALCTSATVAIVVASRGWFFGDDFVNFDIAHNMELSVAYLKRDIFGHILPGHRMLSWLIASQSPVAWWISAVIAAVCILGSMWAVRRLLVMEQASPEVASGAACFVALSGAWMRTSQWYSAMADQFPGAMFALLAACALQQSTRGRRPLWLSAMGICVALGLLFDEKVAIIALMLVPFLWSLGYRSRRQLVEAFGVVCGVLVAWIALVSFDAFLDDRNATPSIGVAVKFVLRAVFTNLIPTVFGWIPENQPYGLDPLIVGAMAIAVVALILWSSAQSGQFRWHPVAWLVALALFCIAPIARSRAVQFPFLAGASHYVVDLVPWALIVLALSVRRARWRGGSAVIMGGAVLFVAVGFVSSVAHSVSRPNGTDARDFVDRLRNSTNDASVYFDGTVPFWVVPSGFMPANRLNSFLRHTSERPQFVRSSMDGVIVTETGDAVPAHLKVGRDDPQKTFRARAVRQCVQGLKRSFTAEITVLAPPQGAAAHVIVFGDFERGEGIRIIGWSGGRAIDVAGLSRSYVVQRASEVLVFPLFDDVDKFEIRLPKTRPACPSGIAVSVPQPDN